MKNRRLHKVLILLAVVLCYGNTLTLKYALDDRMVLLENEYTLTGGWEGAKNILTKDSFTGYYGNDRNLVAGGRYRPVSQLTLMIEYQLFGNSIRDRIGDVHDFENLHDPEHEVYFNRSFLPVVNHFMNVLYFLLLCLLLYDVLSKIFSKYESKKWFQSLAFIAVLLFAIHPIHTEAVANVKGRDEIFAMLGATLALWCSLRYVDTHKWYYLLLSFLAFVFGIFSKENAITYLAVIPLALFFYDTNQKKKIDYLITLLPIILGSIAFVGVRYAALGSMMPADETHNILNNPYIHSSKAEEIATVLLTWGIYLKLLIFPHPLTHDYYPHQIEITDFSNPLVWIIVVGCLFLIGYALWKLKKRTIPAFAILFFVITFSITSNLFFNIGTFMNERFVFIPSMGYTLLIGYAFYLLVTSGKREWQILSMGTLSIVCLLYAGKSITRNMVWKNDYTLFLTDVKTSQNSIKCNISAGGSELQIWKKSHKEKDRLAAYTYLEKALQLDDHALNAYLLLGELLYLDGNIQGALQAYQNAALVEPSNALAQENLAKMKFASEDETLKPIVQLLDEGMNEQNPAKIEQAYIAIDSYLKEHPQSLIGLNIKGNVLGRGMGLLDEAIQLYEMVISADSTFASAWENMAIAYAIKRDFDQAERCFNMALKYAPDNENVLYNIESMRQERARNDR